MLLCAAMYCYVLLCAAMYCYVLLCAAMRCYVLLYAAMCCYVLLCTAMYCYVHRHREPLHLVINLHIFAVTCLCDYRLDNSVAAINRKYNFYVNNFYVV